MNDATANGGVDDESDESHGPSGEASAVESGTVRANGIDAYYERRGAGPPVVFVHGMVLDHSMWDAQAGALAGEFTTVGYDVRGHGRTGGSDRRWYSVGLFAEDLAALLDSLDVERPVICGLSMGGAIAQTYAARHPESVAGLVLADTFTPTLSRRDRATLRSLRATIPAVRLFGFRRVTTANARLFGLLAREDGGEAPAGGGDGRETAGESETAGAAVDPRGDLERLRRLLAATPEMSTDEYAKVARAVARFPGTDLDLASVTAPTLVLYGEREPGLFRRQADRLAAQVPDASLRVVPGAGHASNLDAPEFFTDAVRDLAREAHQTGETGR